MKKLFTLLTVLTTCIVNAQSLKNSIIVKSGISISTINKTATGNYTPGTRNGITLGVTGDFPLSEKIFIQPSLFYTSKGFTANAKSSDQSQFYTKVSPKYIELPVTINYKASISEKIKLFAGGGLYMAAGVGGKYSDETYLFGKPVTVEHKIQFVNAASYNNSIDGQTDTRKMMLFDAGLTTVAGAEIGRIVITAYYGYGLTRINAYKSEALGYSNYTRSFSFTAGFKF